MDDAVPTVEQGLEAGGKMREAPREAPRATPAQARRVIASASTQFANDSQTRVKKVNSSIHADEDDANVKADLTAAETEVNQVVQALQQAEDRAQKRLAALEITTTPSANPVSKVTSETAIQTSSTMPPSSAVSAAEPVRAPSNVRARTYHKLNIEPQEPTDVQSNAPRPEDSFMTVSGPSYVSPASEGHKIVQEEPQGDYGGHLG